MIYWNGSKIYSFIRDSALIQGSYFRYQGLNNLKIASTDGRGFIENIAIVFKSNIVIYGKVAVPHRRTRHIDKIPIISEFEEISGFPERFAIKTKNIDLLRELISMGKKVSWLEPDVFTQANYLGILSFEHVFIDPYINTHVILPTGEVKLAEDVVKRTGFGHVVIKGSKKIGLNFSDVFARISWNKYRRSRFRRGKKDKVAPFLSVVAKVNLYNIFSLTYLIWQQNKLNVMTAKKKIVHKE